MINEYLKTNAIDPKDLSIKYLVAAMSDLAPKLLHCFRKSTRFARSGIYKMPNCQLDGKDFDAEKDIVELLGFLSKLLGIRRSFSTADIRRHEKSSRIVRRAVSEMKLFSKEHYSHRLDSMEDDDMFSSGFTSCLHAYHQNRAYSEELDWPRTIAKHLQLQYLRDRILVLFQEIFRFSMAHQEYINSLPDEIHSLGHGDIQKDEEDLNEYKIVDSKENYVYAIKCKQGLDIANVEDSCGDYVTTFERVLRVYKWLQKTY